MNPFTERLNLSQRDLSFDCLLPPSVDSTYTLSRVITYYIKREIQLTNDGVVELQSHEAQKIQLLTEVLMNRCCPGR